MTKNKHVFAIRSPILCVPLPPSCVSCEDTDVYTKHSSGATVKAGERGKKETSHYYPRPSSKQTRFTSQSALPPRETPPHPAVNPGLSRGATDPSGPLKVCCGIWHQDVSSRSLKASPGGGGGGRGGVAGHSMEQTGWSSTRDNGCNAALQPD